MDFMGSRELAANLFRATETKAKIEADDVVGNAGLQSAHHEVGKAVRETMIQNSGVSPEDLDTATDIKKIRSDLKRTGNSLTARKDRPMLE